VGEELTLNVPGVEDLRGGAARFGAASRKAEHFPARWPRMRPA